MATSSPEKSSSWLTKVASAALIICAIAWSVSGFSPGRGADGFDLETFGNIPVLNGGRLKPLDTVARTSLLMISGKQAMRLPEGGKKSAVEWAADMLFDRSNADKISVFRIDNPDVLGLLGIEQGTQVLFPFEVISPKLQEIGRQASRAERLEPGRRTPFENAVVALGDRIGLYFRFQSSIVPAGVQANVAVLETLSREIPNAKKDSGSLSKETQELAGKYLRASGNSEFMPIPQQDAGANENAWLGIGEAMQRSLVAGQIDSSLIDLTRIAQAWQSKDKEAFNSSVEAYWKKLSALIPGRLERVKNESVFNRYEPFYKSMVLYVASMILALLYWLTGAQFLNKNAFRFLALGFLIQTAGLLSRMILQGRPPVTNLYSSAVFVGWGAVLFGLIAEKAYRRGMIGLVASATGFVTLIVAHHLSLQGDTMEMMRAVLDSNFWLATHVITITIGYSATFIAGAVGILYLLRRLFDPSWNKEVAGELSRALYGLLCGSAFFSFIGTVLGGIWADQSWGRFWGWDPKENGALLICLWVLFVMHARARRVFSEHIIMALAVFGNVVTVFAWFGVNMLNIGLHSYGYMEQGFKWLVFFSVIQVIIMSTAFLRPKHS